MKEVKSISLKQNNIVIVPIDDEKGNPTGEELKFDVQDIELALKYQECQKRHINNTNWLKMQLEIIKKRPDKKGKYMLSVNEEETAKKIREFYYKEIEALDLFLGEGGTKKLLNGRNPYYEMFEDISEAIEPILPLLKVNFESVGERIKNKYKIDENKEL